MLINILSIAVELAIGVICVILVSYFNFKADKFIYPFTDFMKLTNKVMLALGVTSFVGVVWGLYHILSNMNAAP